MIHERTTADLLVVVDMQRVVTDPASPWHFEAAARLEPVLARLVDAHEGPSVATRFLLDPDGLGTWQRFGARWGELLDHPQWFGLVEVVQGLPVRDKTVYSALDVVRHDLQVDGRLVLAGVETDCCVLATAFAAVDAGVPVVVLRDAVAGPDERGHEGALAALARLPEQVRLLTRDEWLDQGAASASRSTGHLP